MKFLKAQQVSGIVWSDDLFPTKLVHSHDATHTQGDLLARCESCPPMRLQLAVASYLWLFSTLYFQRSNDGALNIGLHCLSSVMEDAKK
ncbi:hypothetical protein Pelo_4837 [Pelomyxa schiedti]|nr:hypothetical protein Pelo_4837 [Pelomyxa schiedti]